MREVKHDKSTWGEGPWQHEPDRLEFEHAGLPCLIVRNHFGALCGYVGVSPGHPLHKVPYSEHVAALRPLLEKLKGMPMSEVELTFSRCIELVMAGNLEPSPAVVLDVHGGITFSDGCDPDGPICHTPKPGESDDVWWFGFDCGHCFDYMPRMVADDKRRFQEDGNPIWLSTHAEDVYRNVDYVRAECYRLAEQLVALAKDAPTRRIELE